MALLFGNNPVPQVFQVESGTWRNLAELGQDLYPQMFLAPNGKVFNPGPSGTTRYLDTAGTGAWSPVADRVTFPGSTGPTYRDYGSAVMYAPGKILVMGGGDPPTNTAEVIDLNQSSPAWRAVGSMAFARRQLNATLLPDGTVLVTGGTRSALLCGGIAKGSRRWRQPCGGLGQAGPIDLRAERGDSRFGAFAIQ